MKVLVSGANGFLGSEICREFIGRGAEVYALARKNSNTELVPVRAETVRGDFHVESSIRPLLQDILPDVVVHAAAVVSMGAPDLDTSMRINVEGTRTFADAARFYGVSRWLQISRMSAHPANKSVYGGTKYAQEFSVRDARIPWTIFRPSLIYGHRRRGIFHKLTKMMAKIPVVPLVGMGNEPMRPVHSEDLAWAVAESVDREATVGNIYDIGGADPLSFREMLRIMRQTLHKAPTFIPVPLSVCRAIALVGETTLPRPPITTDNIEGIAKARPVEPEPAKRDLGFDPRGFRRGFEQCLEKGLLGEF